MLAAFELHQNDWIYYVLTMRIVKFIVNYKFTTPNTAI